MICHNCDQWHLPKPCQYDFAHCNRCNNYGHLPHFCPRNPIQRGQDPNSVTYAVNVSQIHPELLRKIQVDVGTNVLHLLEQYTQQEVLAYLSRPILPPLQTAVATVPSHAHILPAPRQLHFGSSHLHQRQHSNAGHPSPVVAYDSPSDHQQVRQGTKVGDLNSSPDVPPTPNSPLGRISAPDVKQQKVEGTDDVKNDAAQTKTGSKAKSKRAPFATKDKVTKPKLTTRRAPQPRCADCKKRHKRCDHGPNALNVGVYGASQSPRPVETPSTKTGTANTFGDDIRMPGPTEDMPSSISRLPISQSDRHDAGTQMTFDTQDDHVEVITQAQQDALRAVASTMPASQYQGHFGQTQWMHNAAQQAMSGHHEQGTLAPVVENTVPPLMSFNQEESHFGDFRPQAHVLESDGDAFVHTDRQMAQTADGSGNTIDPNQMSQNPGFAAINKQRIIAPSHHNSSYDIFTFDDNNQVVNSVEEEGVKDTEGKKQIPAEGGQDDGVENAEASKGSAGGRKPGKYLQASMQPSGGLTNFPEDDEMLD